jgi:hypothetical protein
VHQSDDYSLAPDTIPAADERIYIIYSDNENDPVATRDVRTNHNGLYHFQHLRKGNYVVYAFSEFPNELNNEKVAELKHVRVGSGTTYADTIYIHRGRGYGLSMIKGIALVQYYDRQLPYRDPYPATGERIFLKRSGEDFIFNDVRVSDQGVYIFDRVPPGEYEIYANQEVVGNRRIIIPTDSISPIIVKEPHKIYEVKDTIIIDLNL